MSEPIFELEWITKIKWWERIILLFIPHTMITWDDDGKITYYKIWRGKVYVLGGKADG